jgi:hypothetical protein
MRKMATLIVLGTIKSVCRDFFYLTVHVGETDNEGRQLMSKLTRSFGQAR